MGHLTNDFDSNSTIKGLNDPCRVHSFNVGLPMRSNPLIRRHTASDGYLDGHTKAVLFSGPLQPRVGRHI